MTASLDGRSALVTGGSRGIGLATARLLVDAGARVLCLARPGRRLDEAVASLGERAVAIGCNLSHGDDIDRAVDTVRQECDGAPDALVQGAGLFPLASFERTAPREFAETMQVNLLGPYRLAQPIVAAMRDRGSGHVVTIGSVADRLALPENVAYAASKFGARAVHEVLREELRGTSVRVSLVSPGPVDTGIWDAIDPDSRPGFTPRARMLRPESVAEAIMFVMTLPADVNIDELRLSRA
ncbi:MAG TPA: SDR family oxidoreductase [Gemmatimonadaceae bacterium]